jgi:hypothetical protein
VAAENALAYYDTATITAVKSVIAETSKVRLYLSKFLVKIWEDILRLFATEKDVTYKIWKGYNLTGQQA